MELDWSAYPHLSQHLSELAEHYAKGLGDPALADCPYQIIEVQEASSKSKSNQVPQTRVYCQA